jgi:hypothetical protein
MDQAESLRRMMDDRGQSLPTHAIEFIGTENRERVRTILADLAERLSSLGQRVLVVEPEVREKGVKMIAPGIYQSGSDRDAALGSSHWDWVLIVKRVTSENGTSETLQWLKANLRQDVVVRLKSVFFEDESLQQAVMNSKSLVEWKAEGLERILSMAEGNRPIEILDVSEK